MDVNVRPRECTKRVRFDRTGQEKCTSSSEWSASVRTREYVTKRPEKNDASR